MPTAGGLKATLELCAEVPGVHYSLQADVSKAHRRFLHAQEDWGLLACRLEAGKVWLNRVGTFGVGSASYWWGRLAAGLARLTLSLVGQDFVWQHIYADDLKWSAHGANKFENLALTIFSWAVCGTPFSWKKTRGGFQLDWIGYWSDYSTFSLGISEGRAKWLIGWITDLLCEGHVLIRGLT